MESAKYSSCRADSSPVDRLSHDRGDRQAALRGFVPQRRDLVFGELDLHADHGELPSHNDGTLASMMACCREAKMTMGTRSRRRGAAPPRRQKLNTQSVW